MQPLNAQEAQPPMDDDGIMSFEHGEVFVITAATIAGDLLDRVLDRFGAPLVISADGVGERVGGSAMVSLTYGQSRCTVCGSPGTA